MKAKKFEQQFDEGVDITASLDLSKAKRVLQEQKRVNVDFPTWMIDSLDREASKLGVTRQSVIKCRIPDDCIDEKRYPLFMARAVLKELIESLQSTGSEKSC